MFWSKGQRCLCFLPALWIPALPRSTFGVPSAQEKTPIPSSRARPLCPNCRKPCVHWCHHRPSRCKKWYNLTIIFCLLRHGEVAHEHAKPLPGKKRLQVSWGDGKSYLSQCVFTDKLCLRVQLQESCWGLPVCSMVSPTNGRTTALQVEQIYIRFILDRMVLNSPWNRIYLGEIRFLWLC